MAIITVFSASFCNENEITERLAERLGYDLVGENLIKDTSGRFHVSEKKLASTLKGQVSFLNNVTREREQNTAYLTLALSELVKQDNVIYLGPASHLLPRDITHILKVCIVANHEYKIKQCMDLKGTTDKIAQKLVEKDDENRFKWTQFLFNQTPWDKSLYDIFIPMHTSSISDAIDIISENVNKEALATTPASQRAMDDLILASKVNIPLVEAGFNLDVESDDGSITLSLKTYVIRLEHLKEKLVKIIAGVPGVKHIDVVMGPDVKVPSRYDELEAVPRFLLVDDEKEFVQTLSDRLQTRDLESAIAYDGEEALSYIEKDEPDVMVLDLKMPGVNGIDVLRKVKKERPQVEVIILTGHGSEKDKATALELGAFAYLEKPVDIEVLAKTMKEAYKKIGDQKEKANL
jgi:CheY-like chemotaxis protein/cytidylate kinase